MVHDTEDRCIGDVQGLTSQMLQTDPPPKSPHRMEFCPLLNPYAFAVWNNGLCCPSPLSNCPCSRVKGGQQRVELFYPRFEIAHHYQCPLSVLRATRCNVPRNQCRVTKCERHGWTVLSVELNMYSLMKMFCIFLEANCLMSYNPERDKKNDRTVQDTYTYYPPCNLSFVLRIFND